MNKRPDSRSAGPEPNVHFGVAGARERPGRPRPKASLKRALWPPISFWPIVQVEGAIVAGRPWSILTGLKGVNRPDHHGRADTKPCLSFSLLSLQATQLIQPRCELAEVPSPPIGVAESLSG